MKPFPQLPLTDADFDIWVDVSRRFGLDHDGLLKVAQYWDLQDAACMHARTHKMLGCNLCMLFIGRESMVVSELRRPGPGTVGSILAGLG